MNPHDQPRFIALPTASNPLGALTFIDGERTLPFLIRRVYYVHDIPATVKRGGHAHTSNHELIIAMHGGFDVHLELPSGETSSFHLSDPRQGLYVPPIYWRVLDGYTDDALCLVLASELYEPEEYIRDYEVFKATTMQPKPRM